METRRTTTKKGFRIFLLFLHFFLEVAYLQTLKKWNYIFLNHALMGPRALNIVYGLWMGKGQDIGT